MPAQRELGVNLGGNSNQLRSIMNPLFKRAARRAEASGLQDELLERYFFSNLEPQE